MKRLVLLVEGDGDVQAVPSLVGRLLAELTDVGQGLYLDTKPMRTGGIHQITGPRQKDLARHLVNAVKRPDLGAVLLILDGDANKVEGKAFCAVDVARQLTTRATMAGAGTQFSFAVVFLRQEFESLLIASAHQLPGLKPQVSLPSAPEESPRDAKGWLHANLINGYDPVVRQLELTHAVKDWTPMRSLKCFQRLERALVQLATAVATGQHIVSPASSAN